MRDVKLNYPVAELHGAVEKNGAVNRQKKYRDAQGRILKEGKQEMYHITNPRNFTAHPQTPAERAHHERFSEASHRATAILHVEESLTPDAELLQQLADFKARFNAQLKTTRGSKPDPDAPIDPKTGKPKRYILLPAFIRAIIYNQLKSNPS